jgi:hypothetical protein
MMQTFYSVIKIAPNTITDDSLSIGLLAWNGNEFLFQFSEERKNGIKRFIGSNNGVIDFVVKQLSEYVNRLNKELENNQTSVFQFDSILNSEYFNYLNTYSNGLLRFSKPNLINDKIDNNSFSKLFSLLVDSSLDKKTVLKDDYEVKFNSTIKSKLINVLSNKIHTEKKIDKRILPSMYFSYELDCIGLNGALVGAKSIHFNKSFETIDKNISHYSYLISLLSNKYSTELKKNNFFLIADEPVEINTPEHKTWESIKENPLFKLINTEELFKVTSVVETTNANKFLE